jgi:tetratricopeptide (TPR) repeat protein
MKLSAKALEFNPYLTELSYLNAIACINDGEMEQAHKNLLEIQKSDDAKQFPQTDHLLGVIFSKRGDFNKAADHYRTFLASNPQGPAAEDAKRKLNEWEALGVIAKAPAAPAGTVTAVKE